jgi:hypothetical protein
MRTVIDASCRAYWVILSVPCPGPAYCGIAAISLLSSSVLFLSFIWAAGLARDCVKLAVVVARK